MSTGAAMSRSPGRREQFLAMWRTPGSTGRARRVAYAPELGILVIEQHACRHCRTALLHDCGRHVGNPPVITLAYWDVSLMLARQTVTPGQSVC